MKFSKKILTVGLSVAILSGSYLNANALESIDKIQGKDRYETAALIADKLSKKEQYKTAILVNSDKNLSDGLSASGLAGVEGAPILLVKNNQIPKVTLDKIKNLKYVYIIGGYSSINSSVENELDTHGIDIVRISGKDRIDTSLNVAKEIERLCKVEKVILTNGFKGEADAMSASSVAVRDKAPIILTDGQKTIYNVKDKECYAIGGASSISENLINNTNSKRIGGVDRFDTNKKIIKEFYKDPTEFYISKAYNLVDALTGSTLAENKPVILVENNSNKSILRKATKMTTLGGIDNNVLVQCKNIANATGDIYTGADINNLNEAKRIAMNYYNVSKIYSVDEIANVDEGVFMDNMNYNFEGNSYYRFSDFDIYSEGDIRLCVNKNNTYDVKIVFANYESIPYYTDRVVINRVDKELRAEGIIADFIEVVSESDYAYYIEAYNIVDGKKVMLSKPNITKYNLDDMDKIFE